MARHRLGTHRGSIRLIAGTALQVGRRTVDFFGGVKRAAISLPLEVCGSACLETRYPSAHCR